MLIGDAHLKVDLNNRVKSRRVVPIDQITIHPNYNPSTKHNDIGLVKLRDKVVLSANVKPACLPQPVNRLEMGNNQSLLTAAGWGLTEFAGIYTLLSACKVHTWNQLFCTHLRAQEAQVKRCNTLN